MPPTRPPYPSELKRQIVELVRAGRSPSELAKEFEPTAQTIQNWIRQADRDEGLRKDGLKSDEREELRRLRRENKQFAHRARDIVKSSGLVRSGDRRDTRKIFAFVKAHQARWPIATQCRVLGVSLSGYYARRTRPPSKRAKVDMDLKKHIKAFHTRSDSTYGAPRIWKDLMDIGILVGKKRVARLMREMTICGVSRRKSTRTTVKAHQDRKAPDLVKRDFTVPTVNKLWVADITYVPTWSGFLYLSVVVDAFSRRVVGWAMASHLQSELVVSALNMALYQRRPEDVIHHSDQGAQYTSIAFGKRCREAGVRPSMGSAGDCYDNALCESFFATLECELIDRRCFRTHKEARLAIFSYIEGWYNPHRRHSSIAYHAPMAYEKLHLSLA